MVDQDKEKLQEFIDKMSNYDGYMIGVTTIKGGMLEHTLVIKNFPEHEMLRSHKKVKELVVKDLEKDKIGGLPIETAND